MRKRGFTLIELLVVMAIIGMLASIITAATSSARDRAKAARSLADQTSIVTALQAYFYEKGTYPCAGHYYPGWQGNPADCLNADPTFTKYFAQFPAADPWGEQYVWHWHPGSNECTFLFSFGNAGGDWWNEHNCVCQAGHICKFLPRPPEIGQ